MRSLARILSPILLLAAPLFAQTNTAGDSVQALRTPGWNKGVFIGGSQSFANTPSAQTFLVAGRVGRVLTHELGSNALRGSFEMAIDIIPLNEFWIGGNAQYAAAINPELVDGYDVHRHLEAAT